MDYSAIFKEIFVETQPKALDQDSIQAAYDQQEEEFLKQVKESYPDVKIWRHGYRRNPYLFCIDNDVVEFDIRVTRFMIAKGPNEGETFTFYGSLFIAGSKFSRQFIQSSISDSRSANGVKYEVCCCTLSRWRKACISHDEQTCSRLDHSHLGCLLSHLIASCLIKEHRVPFWHFR